VAHKSKKDVKAGDKSAPAKDKEQRNITCGNISTSDD